MNVCSKLLASDDNGSANAYPVGYVHVTLCDVVSGIRVVLSCFSMRIAVTFAIQAVACITVFALNMHFIS